MVFDLSRRKLLAGLGLASMPATATIALATAPVVIGELSELMEISRQLAIFEAELPRAEQEKADAVAHYDATKPAIPEELICPEYVNRMRNPLLHLSERLHDSVHDARNDYRQFYSHQLREALATLPKGSRSEWAKTLRRLLALAERHEAACDVAWDEYCRRVANHERVRIGIERLTSKIHEIEATTMTGVTIKARALVVATRVADGYYKRLPAERIGPSIAADIVRLSGAMA